MEAGWIVMLLSTAALLVRIGQIIGAIGVARAKNVASAGIRGLADLCVAILAFWAIGAAIYFQQDNNVFAVRPNLLIGWQGLPFDWFRILVPILIATGVVAPAIGERSRLAVPLTLGALLAAVIVPVILQWTRLGWLFEHQFQDAGGAAALHLAPAVCAAVAAIVIGPREGKYNRDRSSNMIPGHSVGLIVISLLLMIIGWIPYLIMMESSDAASIAANVMISAAAGGVASMLVTRLRYGKTDVLQSCSGVLAGLVAISAAGGHVGTPAAFAIGLVAGYLIPSLIILLDVRFHIDDPAGVIAAHGGGAIWALIAAPLFQPAPTAERFKLLGVAMLGIFVVIMLTATLSLLAMLLLRAIVPIRVPASDEFDGLDLADHDINAHPDFQQITIKSYHLREA